MPDPFPPIDLELIPYRGADRNPAVQLFGRRFFSDQTVPEILVELLIVASSQKRIGAGKCIASVPAGTCFPPLDLMRAWPENSPLEYETAAHLDLKLFAFIGASKLETRHAAHRQRYECILSALRAPANLSVTSGIDRNDVLKTLENLFLGFQGIGGSRTWCAQSFVPVIPQLLAGESIWQETRANQDGVHSWEEALDYFSHSQQIFLARGGELLYLQVCNALAQDGASLATWDNVARLALRPEERNPDELRDALSAGLGNVLNGCPDTVGDLADFINTVAGKSKDADREAGQRWTPCGWCPQSSWQEGAIFAVHLLRLCEASLDPLERLSLLETSCALQILRSLGRQSALSQRSSDMVGGKNPLCFIWAVSDPDGLHETAKQISRRSVKANQRMIHDAIRQESILKILEKQKSANAAAGRSWDEAKVFREADSRYGHKLFISLAKRIGLITPKRGQGARFVLNDRILRCIVMSVLPPGTRVTYDTFKQLLRSHFGMVVDDDGLCDACEWNGTGRLSTLGGNSDQWLVSMLDAAGMLVRLSDSCSLVRNPFGDGEEAQ